MIARLTGTIVQKSLPHCIVETNGVGYEVTVPLSTYYELPECGVSVTLHIHTFVKDDAIDLYGFYTESERDIFRHLITVSGIGPKQAVNILSGISPSALMLAIQEGDVNKLTSIPGIGKKMAGRLILELKDKLPHVPVTVAKAGETRSVEWETVKRDVLSALINLGYKTNLAKMAIEQTCAALPSSTVSLDQLLKETLRYLSGGPNLGR